MWLKTTIFNRFLGFFALTVLQNRWGGGWFTINYYRKDPPFLSLGFPPHTHLLGSKCPPPEERRLSMPETGEKERHYLFKSYTDLELWLNVFNKILKSSRIPTDAQSFPLPLPSLGYRISGKEVEVRDSGSRHHQWCGYCNLQLIQSHVAPPHVPAAESFLPFLPGKVSPAA